jgi:metallo-beta-lactamase class B
MFTTPGAAARTFMVRVAGREARRKRSMNPLSRIAIVAACCAVAASAVAQQKQEQLSETYRGSRRNDVEYQKVAPFKVFDNLYYVCPGFVSVWLIPTSNGLILIDAAQEPYVDHVIDSIRKVGFDPRDIKYMLISHGHLDHFGGVARIQQLSRARVAALEEDWQLIEAAAKTPGRDNVPAPQVPARDMVVKEGDTITLGNTSLKVYRMPGHTPGSASFEFTVLDGGRPHKAFLFGGPGPRGGVQGAEQFLSSVGRLAQIPGVQVSVPVHSWLNDFPYPNGGVLERAQKLAQRKPGEPHPFVDPASWQAWVKQVQDGAIRNLEQEKQKAR